MQRIGSKIEIIGSGKGANLSQTYVRDASTDIEGVASDTSNLTNMTSHEEVSTMDGHMPSLTKEGRI